MKGLFSEEALLQYAELVAQSKSLDFSEDEFYDFTRCVRPNGTAYGTKGKCKKGTEQAKEVKSVQVGSKEGPKELYAKLMRQQQELVQKGDIDGAMKLQKKMSIMVSVLNDLPEIKAQVAKTKEQAEKKEKEEEKFETAQKKRDEGQKAAKLSPRDKKVITDYTKETMGQSARSYDNMNGCLRRPPTCPDTKESGKFVKEFDAALSKLPKNEEGNAFYRGVRVEDDGTRQLYETLVNAQPGTRLKDPGYGSYSSVERRAKSFAKGKSNIMFVTRNKNMAPINMYSDVKDEYEAILPRGTEQTIRKVTKEGNTLIVEID
jgi:hypothetical protein